MSILAEVQAGRPVLAQSFEQWREAARVLLAHGVAPHAVQWITHHADGDLFAGVAPAARQVASAYAVDASVATPDAHGAGDMSSMRRDARGRTPLADGDLFADMAPRSESVEEQAALRAAGAAANDGLSRAPPVMKAAVDASGDAPPPSAGDADVTASDTASDGTAVMRHETASDGVAATPPDTAPDGAAVTPSDTSSDGMAVMPPDTSSDGTTVMPPGAAPDGVAATPSDAASDGTATMPSAARSDGVASTPSDAAPDGVAAPPSDAASDGVATMPSAAPDGAAAPRQVAAQPSAPAMRVPRALMDMLHSASCFRSSERWAFLYRVIWRWQRGEHEVASPADEDGARLHGMVKAVRREEHDMHAYVRFRERPEAAGAPRFVAWFEPSHDVLPQVARHFAARMGRVTWMLATPEATVLWDGAALHMLPPSMRGAADIEDAGEALWLTYYRSIFNPARLNAGLMHSHIPSRFWKNLPEGAVVPEMVTQAAAGARRTGQTASVGQRGGNVIALTAAQAQPSRDASSTLDQCRRCELWQHATQAVGGAGPARARLMLVGEQPGDQEDLAGKAFIGPAGAVLDDALRQAGVARDGVYLTNAVKHFKWEPRGKRRMHKTPAQREVAACRHWLEQELASVDPAVVVALGATALKSIMDDAGASLKAVLGRPFQHQGRWVLAIYHPAYVLRAPDPATRRDAFEVMVAGLREALRLAGGAP